MATKTKDVKVDQVWTCKFSQRLVNVRVLEVIEDKPRTTWTGISHKRRTRFRVLNLRTDRETKVTAAKLRRFVGMWADIKGKQAAEEIERRLNARSTQSAPADADDDEMDDEGDDEEVVVGPPCGECGGNHITQDCQTFGGPGEHPAAQPISPEEIAARGRGGIKYNILSLMDDEGCQSAIEVAEEWRNNLEAMLECADKREESMIRPLHGLIQDVIQNLLNKANKMEDK